MTGEATAERDRGGQRAGSGTAARPGGARLAPRDRAIGPLLTLALLVVIELIARTPLYIPNPGAIFVTAVVYAAWRGGLRSGLLSALVALLHFFLFYSEPGELFRFTPDGLRRLLVVTITTPAMAVMVGLLKERLDRLVDRLQEEVRRTVVQNAQLREQAEESKELLSRVVEIDPDGIVIIDREGRFSFANAAAERILGRSRDELASMKYDDAVWKVAGPDGEPIAEEDSPYLRAERTGEPVYGSKYAIERPDGGRVVISINAAPLRSRGGAVIGVVGSFRDITEHERADRELRQSLERFSLVARATNDTIWDWDLIAATVTYNETAQIMFDYAADEVGNGLNWWSDRIHPDDREQVLASLRAVVADGAEAWAAEYRFRRGDGSYVTVFDRGYLLHDEKGVPVRMIGSMQDFTERQRREAALRLLAEASSILSSSLDYEETLQSITRLAVPNLACYCVVDIVEANGRVRRPAAAHADPDKEELIRALCRYPLDPSKPEGLHGVLHRGGTVLISDIDDALLQAVAWDEEHLRIIRELGPKSGIGVPLVARGRILGVLTFMRTRPGVRYGPDDLALAEELARRAALAVDNARLYMEAQAASRAKSDFLAVMSHEFRTPLTAVIGYTDLLHAEVAGPLNADQKRRLGLIRASAWHLSGLIEEILAFARMEAGRTAVQLDRSELGRVIAEAAALVEPIATKRGLALRVRAPAEPIEIDVDASKFRQILLNLLSNAVKFTEKGEVEIHGWRDGGDIVVEVRDTGIGIPSEHLEQIFAPFWQVDQSTTRRTGGAGLGLSVTRGLVRLLGGDITVESTVGAGSLFRVRLPASPHSSGAGG